jgi:hypothetical protein
MLHLITLLAVTSAVVTAPVASPLPSPAADAPAATCNAGAMSAVKSANAPKHPIVEFPWTHYLTVEQQNAAMREELDRFFNVDHSP